MILVKTELNNYSSSFIPYFLWSCSTLLSLQHHVFQSFQQDMNKLVITWSPSIYSLTISYINKHYSLSTCILKYMSVSKHFLLTELTLRINSDHSSSFSCQYQSSMPSFFHLKLVCPQRGIGQCFFFVP